MTIMLTPIRDNYAFCMCINTDRPEFLLHNNFFEFFIDISAVYVEIEICILVCSENFFFQALGVAENFLDE